MPISNAIAAFGRWWNKTDRLLEENGKPLRNGALPRGAKCSQRQN